MIPIKFGFFFLVLFALVVGWFFCVYMRVCESGKGAGGGGGAYEIDFTFVLVNVSTMSTFYI